MGLGLGLGPRLPAARRTLHGHRRAGAPRARVAGLQHPLPSLPHALAPQLLQQHGAPRLVGVRVGARVGARVRVRVRVGV